MPTVLIPINQLRNSPWHFRIMYQDNFDAMIKSIHTHGIESMPNPLVAMINGEYYIVDGHSRIKAAKNAGVKKISCHVLKNVKNFNHLRIQSFQHNKEGYSNPLLLSDMFYEDVQLHDGIEKVSMDYGVSENYVQSMLNIRILHDDTKSIINKIIQTSKTKYHSVLNQITPQHLASLASLDVEKQIQVANWIFRDIVYGPPDESLISIPSIYEIVDEITKISNIEEKRTYKKNNNEKQKEIPLVCRCGAKFDVNTKTSAVYEYIEKNNVIIKRKFESNYSTSAFSSRFYGKSELVELIKNASCEVSVILSQESSDESRK